MARESDKLHTQYVPISMAFLFTYTENPFSTRKRFNITLAGNYRNENSYGKP